MQGTPGATLNGTRRLIEPPVETGLQRLNHLEHQVRWWYGLGLLVIAVLVLMLALGATKGMNVLERFAPGRIAPVFGKPISTTENGGGVCTSAREVLLTAYGCMRCGREAPRRILFSNAYA